MILENGEIILHDRVVKGDVEIEGNEIKRIGRSLGRGMDCSSKLIATRLIDIHIHGCRRQIASRSAVWQAALQ
jgi:dihydroorotase-like cyclic amidohydrolase